MLKNKFYHAPRFWNFFIRHYERIFFVVPVLMSKNLEKIKWSSKILIHSKETSHVLPYKS